MFYTNFLYVKKGELGRLWIAAFQAKKLTKQFVAETDIQSAVASIDNPTTPLALRLSAPLLLGLVRIYERKTGYVADDANDVLQQNKKLLLQSQQAATNKKQIDLDPQHRHAHAANINLPVPDYSMADQLFNIDLDDLLPDIEMYGDDELKSSELVQQLRRDNGYSLENQRNLAGHTDIPLIGGLDDDLEAFADDIDINDEPSIQHISRMSTHSVASDIERPRDAGVMINTSARPVQLDESIDVNKTAASMRVDEGEFDRMSLANIVPSPVKKKQKREVKVQLDDATQIRSAEIKAGMENTSALIYVTGRPTFHDVLKQRVGHFDMFGAQSLFDVRDQAFIDKLQHNYNTMQASLQAAHQSLGRRLSSADVTQQVDFSLPEGIDMEDVESLAQAEQQQQQQPADVDVESVQQADVTAAGEPQTLEEDIAEMEDEKQADDVLAMESQQFFNEKSSQQYDKLESSEQTTASGHKYSSRTIKMHAYLAQQFGRGTKSVDELSFDKLVPTAMHNNKRVAAGIFYQLLVLKNNNFVDCEQSVPFGDIRITKTDEFPDRLRN